MTTGFKRTFAPPSLSDLQGWEAMLAATFDALLYALPDQLARGAVFLVRLWS